LLGMNPDTIGCRINQLGIFYGETPENYSRRSGRRHMEGVEADYIIYRFAELRQAIEFFDRL